MNAVRSQQVGGTVSGSLASVPPHANLRGRAWDFWAIRVALVGASVALCYALRPFNLHAFPAAGLGFFIAMVVLLAELRLRHAEISGLAGGAIGLVVGLLASLLIALVVARTSEPETTKSFFEFTATLSLGYLGLAIGARKGKDLPHIPLPHSVGIASPVPPSAPESSVQMKLLDTSVLIDGRIADICETAFSRWLAGTSALCPSRLQMVADSSDSLKRQRGRRGLEVLQRLQKMPGLDLRLLDDDIAGVSAVDQKLVELAQRTGSKIVTNDFNLNKVATRAEYLRPEHQRTRQRPQARRSPRRTMRVLILREGKESSQGVAFLDDGTMVVVDGARRLINRTVDILVTSVHQTPRAK